MHMKFAVAKSRSNNFTGRSSTLYRLPEMTFVLRVPWHNATGRSLQAFGEGLANCYAAGLLSKVRSGSANRVEPSAGAPLENHSTIPRTPQMRCATRAPEFLREQSFCVLSKAQVRRAHLFVGQQFFRFALEGDHAVFHHVSAIGNAQTIHHVLLDQEHRDAAFSHLLNLLENLFHHFRRQAQRGFIEEKQLRLSHQRPRDGHHLLLATGERTGKLLAALFESRKKIELLVHRLLEVRPGSPDVRAQGEIFFHTHMGKKLATLGDVADPAFHDLVWRNFRDILTEKAHGAALGSHQAGDDPEGRCLTGAIRSDQGHDLAGVNLQGDIKQRLKIAVGGADPVRCEQRRGHSPSSLYLDPRYASITSGLRTISCGVPSPIIVPWSRTITRSAMRITTCMTCSTPATAEMPHSGSLRSSSARASASEVERPATTSSSKISFGRVANARAISRRLSMGSDRPRAGRCMAFPICRNRSTFSASSAALAGLLVCRNAPSIVFSSTLRLRSGLTIWKVRPMPRCTARSGLNREISLLLKWIFPSSG